MNRYVLVSIENDMCVIFDIEDQMTFSVPWEELDSYIHCTPTELIDEEVERRR